MRNAIMFIVLCVFQCACAAQLPMSQQSQALLELSDLAGEITVKYEAESVTPASSGTVDKNRPDTS